ncbi:isochorismate synthase MenF [Rhodoferax lithotrophicus]|uniref:Isochorismate synthase MenF n=1 Tax=Rhodoferax lithotrophicus TaxID=2798804 RepID=A0ABN6D4B7_9BURK|nr:aminodeoxychorismate synthase component I [Rhodoferax sp. MIZ03]BCO26825.1 isochorismate synthase MenF [Rhodoferax sp. MIZ03]
MQVLIDFCDPHGGGSTLRCAFDAPLQTLVAQTLAEVKPLLDQVSALSQQGFWCVGYLRYEAAPAFDAALAVHQADGPLAWFGVYPQALPWPDETSAQETTQVSWRNTLSRADFEAHMAHIHQAIAAGEFYQVNYTAPLTGEFTGSPLELFSRLQRAQPQGYAAYFDTGLEQLLSVSPELFFDWQPGADRHSGQILTRPMKGTAPRGNSPAEDAALAQAMQASPKERAENVMIVDLLRNDLSRIAEPFSVKVPELFKVQTLPTVFQMVSDVTAHTRPGIRLTDVFTALFPCGSITGAPKVQAMRTLQTLEPEPRGVYCGTIGVVRPGGHATFNVAIRTVTLRGPAARCGIGSGITFDASAAAEWQEWQHKRAFLDRASTGFELLETLRLERGEFINLIAHLARLKRAARHFGYVFDENSIQAALQALRAEVDTDHNVWRVRLLLAANGQVQAEKFIHNQLLAPVLIAQAATPFEATKSEFTRFKTTRRAHYEAFAPTNPEVFDTLLYNVQGELTECTRGNIALKLDGQWLTPALHCGLLDGVGREMALQQGRLREAVIRLEDLPRVQAVAFVNSLRGWVQARLITPITS